MPGKRDDTKLMRTRLSRAGGMYLNQVIENGDVLGVAWGRTIHQMSKTMTPKSCKNVTVIQMLGSMPSQPDLTIIESSSQIAYKLSGRVASLHVPPWYQAPDWPWSYRQSLLFDRILTF